MEFGKDRNDEKFMFLGKEWDAEKMLHLYIYNYMKKRGLHGAAETFAKETNIEMLELDYDEGLLTDWWELFWPKFCSRMTQQVEGNPQSSAQPPIKVALDMLAAMKSPKAGGSRQPLTGNLHVNNVMGQPPASVLQTFPGISQRRAGKHPMTTDTTSIPGKSAARAMGKGPLGFPPVKLLPTEITAVLPPGNPSHLQRPVTIQPPPQVVRAPQSVQLESTYPAGQDLAYSPAAPNTGEDKWKNQASNTRVRVEAIDGLGPDSFMSQVPASFFKLMQQEAQTQKRHWNPPTDKS